MLTGFICTAVSNPAFTQMLPESVNSTNRENSISGSELNESIVKENVLMTPTDEEMSFIMYRDRVTTTLSDNLYRREIKEEFNFNPVKSLNGNLKFGGFYNGGIDLYFAPEMYIQPFDGVSIYAIRHSHVYIPLEEMQENIQPLLLETVFLAAIENAVNYFTLNDEILINKVLNGILNFALKNGFTFITQAVKKEDPKIPTWEYYYCSIGIRF
ncbi:MAG TPA: hypothetical protein VK004_04925 [Ignavibacteria bacterium]|nr:hypothetical protein [Ignavibacteria bacterium]